MTPAARASRRRIQAEELAVEQQTLAAQVQRIDRAGDDRRRAAEHLVIAAERQLVAAQAQLASAERLDALEDQAMDQLVLVHHRLAGVVSGIEDLAVPA